MKKLLIRFLTVISVYLGIHTFTYAATPNWVADINSKPLSLNPDKMKELLLTGKAFNQLAGQPPFYYPFTKNPSPGNSKILIDYLIYYGRTLADAVNKRKIEVAQGNKVITDYLEYSLDIFKPKQLKKTYKTSRIAVPNPLAALPFDLTDGRRQHYYISYMILEQSYIAAILSLARVNAMRVLGQNKKNSKSLLNDDDDLINLINDILKRFSSNYIAKRKGITTSEADIETLASYINGSAPVVPPAPIKPAPIQPNPPAPISHNDDGFFSASDDESSDDESSDDDYLHPARVKERRERLARERLAAAADLINAAKNGKIDFGGLIK
jgi:hypothetical protein